MIVPFTAFFCCVPIVCRAARVALAFAVAAVFCSTVRGVAAFLGLRPKSARTSGEWANVAFTNASNSASWRRRDGAWVTSSLSLALVTAFAASTRCAGR